MRSTQISSPTSYPEVNTVLNVLLLDIQAILGYQFIGIYLPGSLASGDFDQSSDVDFIVVTDSELSEHLYLDLQAMHARVAALDSWCATQLEGSYVPKNALRRYDPLRGLYLHIVRGRDEPLQKMQLDNAVLSRA